MKISPSKTKRNLELTILRSEGRTYASLAKKYKISYTRVRDIYKTNKKKLKKLNEMQNL